MKRGRIFLLLILIIALGLVVVFFVMQQMGGTGGTPSAEITPTPTEFIDMVDVVVVTQHVERGQTINPDALDLVPYRRDAFFEGMFTNKEAATGMRARLDLEPGFVLTTNMVAAPSELVTSPGSEWALEIPRGMVAVSIPINRLSAVSFAPQRGDHVNVIVTMLVVELDTDFQSRLPNASAQVLGPMVTEDQTTLAAQALAADSPLGRGELDVAFEQNFYAVPGEMQRPRLVSQTLIQDVIVLYMGTFPTQAEQEAAQSNLTVVETPGGPTPTVTPPPTNPQPQGTPAPVVAPPMPDVITLIVSPQEAVTLNYLIFSGSKLTLALRGVEDDTRTQTEAVTLQYLLDQYSIPIPVKLPYGLEPRVDDLNLPSLPNDVTPTPVP